MYSKIGKNSTCSKFGGHGVPINLSSPYYWWYTNGWNICSEVGARDVGCKMDVDSEGIVHQIELEHHWLTTIDKY
jgi:hypothetical protein